MNAPTTAKPRWPMRLDANVSLAGLTTLGVGGPAKWRLWAETVAAVQAGVRWAREKGGTLEVVSGGSNVLADDYGFDGVVLQPAIRGFFATPVGDRVLLTVGSGEPWDEVVARTVAEGWQGIECLSGIPGWAGAAPVQNIGAYGQEVADTLYSVEAVDRRTGDVKIFGASDCGFAYRDSRFKREGHWIITHVTLALRPNAVPALRYPELQTAVAALAGPGQAATVTLPMVREAVIGIRRKKSMVLGALAEAGDENQRSAGSFFLNPIVSKATADAVRAAVAAHDAAAAATMPMYPVAGDAGQMKLSAAWLIEKSGLQRGHGSGAVGLSSRHTLAIVNRGGATSAQILRFAESVQHHVKQAFGVVLQLEVVRL